MIYPNYRNELMTNVLFEAYEFDITNEIGFKDLHHRVKEHEMVYMFKNPIAKKQKKIYSIEKEIETENKHFEKFEAIHFEK